MISLSSRHERPVWDQVAEGLRLLLADGGFLPGEQLPEAETLAAQLALNPAAVRDAYRTLEEQGLLVPRETGGPEVAEGASQARQDQLLQDWDKATGELLVLGYPKAELEKRLKEVRA